MQVTNIGKLTGGGRNNAVMLGALAAVIAAILLIVFVSAYRDSGKSDATVVTAFVAKRLIPKGTSGSEIAAKALYTPTQVDSGQLRAGAITDPALMAGRTLQADVFPGSQIAESDFSGADPGTTTGVAGVVSSSLTGVRRAVTVTVDPINGSLSQVATGDRVDIYQQLESGGSRIIKLLRADVPILLNDGSGNVVLDVPAADAPDVLFASKNTELLFSIRPASGAKPTLPRTANNETMLRYDRTH